MQFEPAAVRKARKISRFARNDTWSELSSRTKREISTRLHHYREVEPFAFYALRVNSSQVFAVESSDLCNYYTSQFTLLAQIFPGVKNSRMRIFLAPRRQDAKFGNHLFLISFASLRLCGRLIRVWLRRSRAVLFAVKASLLFGCSCAAPSGSGAARRWIARHRRRQLALEP